MNSEPWILIEVQCIIYQWICLDKLQTDGKLFSNFIFELMAKNQKIVKRIERREYCSKCIVIYQWICLDKLYKLVESFFQIFN